MRFAKPLVVALVVAACGKRGDPLPPIRIVPQPVSELRLAQRGDVLETSFIVPRVATDSSRLGVIDIEITRAQKTGDFDKVGVRTTKRAAPGETLVEREELPALGTTVRVAARAISKGHASNRTAIVSLTVLTPPLAPTDLEGEVGPSGNVLRWTYPGPLPTPLPLPTPTPPPTPRGLPSASPGIAQTSPGAVGSPSPPLTPAPSAAATPSTPTTPAPTPAAAPSPSVAATPPPTPTSTEAPLPSPSATVGQSPLPGARPSGAATPQPSPKPVGFLVYRRPNEGSYTRALRNDVFSTMLFEDNTVEPGQEFCYVTRFAMSADPIIESASSNEVCLTFKDIAAPAAPVGVSVFLRPSGVEVSWSPSSEADLAVYRVYRRAPPGEAPVLVGEVAAPETTLKDPGAKPGIANAYVVTAVDKAGNEGPGSAPVQVRP